MTVAGQSAAVAAVWEQHRPTMLERVDVLERAVAGLGAGSLDTSLADAALTAAHQLAGTVGTFGFPRASERAREIELRLDAGATPDVAPALAGLVADIRQDLGPVAESASEPAGPTALPLVLLVVPEARKAERFRVEGGRRGLRVAATASLDDARGRVEREWPEAVVLDLGCEGEALALLGDLHEAHLNPAVVLIDADLPDVLGLELCRVLRNDRRWSVVPIILLVDEADPETVEQMLVVGANDLIARAAVASELVARVHSHLERFRIHQALAETDALTGLGNRRTSTAALSQMIRMAERLDKPMCLVELDIDHFKRVNDVHGHIAGDAALRSLGDLLKRSFRGEDVIARWGGEEFVVGLFGVERDFGIDRISAVLATFRGETFAAGGEEFSLTFSAGVAQYPSDGADLEALYSAVDEALYEAKRAGRDQVVAAGAGHLRTQQVDVAVVEDEDAASELIAYTLTERGHRCWRFSNGAGAIGMLGGETPRVRARVILLDLNMPAVNGIELLTLLGRDGVLRSSRVLVVSARDDAATMAEARGLGAEDYLVKPVDLDMLAAKVESALGRGA